MYNIVIVGTKQAYLKCKIDNCRLNKLSHLIHLLMSNQPALEIKLLRKAYEAFNAHNIDAALALLTPDVALPRAFKSGFVRGHEEIRAYWTEQWSEIYLHDEPVAFDQRDDGQVLVEVHQIVRDLSGAVLADKHVAHRFSIEHGLIQSMEIDRLPSSELDVKQKGYSN